MKNRLSLRIFVFAMFVMLIMSFSLSANAAQTYKPVDTGRKCSLQLTYHARDKYFEGLEIQIFHVADVSSETKYSLTSQFQSYPVNINAISSQTEWDSIASTLTSYIIADAIKPTQEKITDKNGMVKFSNLKTGLYLVRWTKNKTEDNVSGFEPFMMAVPNRDEKGNWNYDIDSYPKPGDYTPTNKAIEYRVVVLWSDSGFEDQRPDSVQIEIFRNGESVGIYTVTAEDNWSYRWKAIDDGSEWTVVEYVSGLKYDITMSKYGNVFTIVNYYGEEEQSSNLRQISVRSDENYNPSPIKTGDNYDIVYFIVAIGAFSGILSFILLAAGRRRLYDK